MVDQLRNLVQKFTSDGVFVLKWGMPGGGDGQFNRAEDCDVDSMGNVFVTDVSNSRIQKFGEQLVPVTLTFFTVERSGEQAVVSWAVNGFAVDFVEFHVYRSAPGAVRTRITDTALAASAQYRFIDIKAPREGADYWLLETGNGVDDYWHGPVSLVPGPELVLHLAPNYPNPFNPTTLIRYTVPEGARVTLAVYDTRGRLIRTLVDERQPPGNYEVAWDGRGRNGGVVPSGVYFARLRAGSARQSRKLVLVK